MGKGDDMTNLLLKSVTSLEYESWQHFEGKMHSSSSPKTRHHSATSLPGGSSAPACTLEKSGSSLLFNSTHPILRTIWLWGGLSSCFRNASYCRPSVGDSSWKSSWKTPSPRSLPSCFTPSPFSSGGFYVISHKIHSYRAVTDVCSKCQSRLTYNFQKADNHLEAVGSKCQTLMLRLQDQSCHSSHQPRQRKAPGRVFHGVTPSTSTLRSHISQTPRRKTAEMDGAAKTPSSPGAWQRKSKIKSTQHKKCGSNCNWKLLLKGRSWSHHLSFSSQSPQSPLWLMTSPSTQTLQHITWVIPKTSPPSASTFTSSAIGLRSSAKEVYTLPLALH